MGRGNGRRGGNMKKAFTKLELERFEKVIDAWKEEDRIEGLAKSYAIDRRDMKEILMAIKEGKYKKAAELTAELDTIVRDLIPTNLYDKIMEYY